MSRSSFILAAALFVVAATMVFISSFDRTHGEAKIAYAGKRNKSTTGASDGARELTSRPRVKSMRQDDTYLSIQKSATTHLNSKELARVDRILSGIRLDSKEQLEQYNRNYGLTKEQQREIFPVIVAHHEQSHPAMMVNDQAIASVNPNFSLDQSVSSFLDSLQREAFLDDAADHEAWWEEVVGQLENDLDTAINNGEMVPAEEASAGLRIAAESAVGDGGTSRHSGGNLFDLLRR